MSEIFKMLGEKFHQPRILNPVKSPFKTEGKIEAFSDKEILREFVATRPALQERLKRRS